jgi:hypothetical protein
MAWSPCMHNRQCHSQPHRPLQTTLGMLRLSGQTWPEGIWYAQRAMANHSYRSLFISLLIQTPPTTTLHQKSNNSTRSPRPFSLLHLIFGG